MCERINIVTRLDQTPTRFSLKKTLGLAVLVGMFTGFRLSFNNDTGKASFCTTSMIMDALNKRNELMCLYVGLKNYDSNQTGVQFGIGGGLENNDGTYTTYGLNIWRYQQRVVRGIISADSACFDTNTNNLPSELPIRELQSDKCDILVRSYREY